MSRFTTEVRYICEAESGLIQSVGAEKIEQVIAEARSKIFYSDYPIFDEAYRPVLESGILRHFYTREIGFETVALWKFKLNTKLREIMPYFNKLYEVDLQKYNPLYTVDYQRTSGKEVEGEHNTNVKGTNTNNTTNKGNVNTYITGDDDLITSSNGNVTTKAEDKGNSKVLFSDTPQGQLSDVENGKYLTQATFNSGENTSTNTTSDMESGKNQRNYSSDQNVDTNMNTSANGSNTSDTVYKISDNETYAEHVFGHSGGTDYSDLVVKYRNSLVNVDMMIYEELEPLFFQLWHSYL